MALPPLRRPPRSDCTTSPPPGPASKACRAAPSPAAPSPLAVPLPAVRVTHSTHGTHGTALPELDAAWAVSLADATPASRAVGPEHGPVLVGTAGAGLFPSPACLWAGRITYPPELSLFARHCPRASSEPPDKGRHCYALHLLVRNLGKGRARHRPKVTGLACGEAESQPSVPAAEPRFLTSGPPTPTQTASQPGPPHPSAEAVGELCLVIGVHYGQGVLGHLWGRAVL